MNGQPNQPRKDFHQIKEDLVDGIIASNRAIAGLKATMQVFIEVSKVKEKTYAELLKTTQERLDEHHLIMYGNGTDEYPGLINDVKNLKKDFAKDKKDMEWRVKTVIGAAISAILVAVAEILVRVFHKGG